VAKRKGGWNLTGFDEHLELWIQLSSPSDDLRVIVANWLLSRIDDPYQGMQREAEGHSNLGHPNLWFGMIPGTRHGYQAVYCSYLIFEQTGTVRCNSVMTLHWPA
jgi:hypothetical protein